MAREVNPKDFDTPQDYARAKRQEKKQGRVKKQHREEKRGW